MVEIFRKSILIGYEYIMSVSAGTVSPQYGFPGHSVMGE